MSDGKEKKPTPRDTQYPLKPNGKVYITKSADKKNIK